MNNIKHTLLMIFATTGFSALAVVVHYTEANKSILYFIGINNLVEGLVLILILFLPYFRDIRDRFRVYIKGYAGVINYIKSKKKLSLMFILLTIAAADYILFGHALKYTNVAIASVLWNLWPIILIIVLNILFNNRSGSGDKNLIKYKRIKNTSKVWIVVCCVGIVLTVLSQYNIDNIDINPYSIYGIILVIIATILKSFNVPLSNKFGVELNFINNDDNNNNKNYNKDLVNKSILFFALLLFGLVVLVTGIIFTSWGFIYHYIINNNTFIDLGIDDKFIFFSIVPALTYMSISIVLIRYVNINSDNSTINMIMYMGPVITLLMLYFIKSIDVIHLDYLILGALLIVISNVMIHMIQNKKE